MKRRNLLIGTSATLVAASGGYTLFRKLSKSAPVENFTPISSFDANTSYDVCVVGTGPAGCTVADKLARDGQTVVLIDSGVSINDSKGYSAVQALDAYSNSGEIDYPLTTSRIRALGGTSTVWTGRCPRLMPEDFRGNPLNPDGWPVSYEDLKPYYQEAESRLFVASAPITQDYAPRDAAFPRPGTKNIRELQEFLDSHGIKADFPPVSSHPQTGGTVRFASDYLPELAARKNVTVLSNTTATRISCQDDTVSGLETSSIEGNTTTIKAKKYVIAGGALESTRLLLVSGNASHPAGIGNHSGHLGRYFQEHPFFAWNATLPQKQLFNSYQLARTYRYSKDFYEQKLGSAVMAFYGSSSNKLRIALGIEMSAHPENRITLSKSRDTLGIPGIDLNFSFTAKDRQSIEFGEGIVAGLMQQFDARDIEPVEDIHWSHHHMGTTRMSDKPEDGVVDRNLKIHGVSNLYVASSSCFRSSGAANPTLTIVALACRLGTHLTDHS